MFVIHCYVPLILSIMTKDTMIWQTLNMVVAGMVINKTLPENKELFEEKCIKDAQGIIAYSADEIREVLNNSDVTGFAEVLAEIYS